MKVKITIPFDCGNAPKILSIKDFNVAFAENNNTYIFEKVTSDIVWEIIGVKQIHGKENFASELKRLRSIEVKEFILTTVVTHGFNGAADGIMKFKDGTTVAFCDIYTFASSTNNAKIKKITSYVISIPT